MLTNSFTAFARAALLTFAFSGLAIGATGLLLDFATRNVVA